MPDGDRYARHALVPGWRQQSLRGARVVVVGMGALGNEVARVLAMAGVGFFVVCDPDRIETSNLSRTVLFREADVGRLKVEAAADALRQLVPGIAVEARPLTLVRGVGLAELRDASLVLGCLDSRTARLQLAGRCNLVGAALIDGGTRPWGGEVRVVLDPDGSCYGCTLSPEDRAVSDQPWSCLDRNTERAAGTTVTSSALVGSWMAEMAVRCLMRLPTPDGVLTVDAERGITRAVGVPRDPECPLHEPIDVVRPVEAHAGSTVGELRALLGAGRSLLAWEAFQERVECPSCDFEEERFALPGRPEVCPRCGQALRPRTTLELDAAPEHMELRALGVAPREILAVRSADGINWVELEASSMG